MVCSNVETDCAWLTRTGIVPERAPDSDKSTDCNADTCAERDDDSDDTAVLRTLAMLAML